MINASKAKEMTVEADRLKTVEVNNMIEASVKKAASNCEWRCNVYSKPGIDLDKIHSIAMARGFRATSVQAQSQRDVSYVKIEWNV